MIDDRVINDVAPQKGGKTLDIADVRARAAGARGADGKYAEDKVKETYGGDAGFSWANRGDGPVTNPTNGERWTWYATDRIARLWSGTKLTGSPGTG